MTDARIREVQQGRWRDLWTLLYATLFALTFVGYPVLSSGLGAFDAYARVFSIVYRAFVVFASLALIWLAVRRLSAEVWRSAAAAAFCALWVMLLARFAWDSSFVPIPLPLEWFDYFLLMVGAVLIPAVALFQAPSERAFDIARRILLCGGVIAGSFVVATVARIVRQDMSLDALRRLGTDELNSVSLGYIGVVLVIVSLLGHPPPATQSRICRILDSRTVRFLAGCLGGFLTIAAASKGPIVALVGVTVVAQAGRILRTRSASGLVLVFTKMAVAFCALVVLAFVLTVFFQVSVVNRFTDFATDTSTSDRVGMFTRALLQFESSPWVGSAFVESQTRFYPHNLFIEVLMAIGIPGLLVLLVVLFAAASSSLRVLHTRHDWVAILCAQQIIGVMFSGSVYFGAELWASLAAVLALDRLLKRQPQPASEVVAAREPQWT